MNKDLKYGLTPHHYNNLNGTNSSTVFQVVKCLMEQLYTHTHTDTHTHTHTHTQSIPTYSILK